MVCGSNIDLFICESLVALQTNAWNLICSIIVCMDGWYCLLGIYFFFISGVFVWLWLCSQHGNICMDSGALRWSAYISQSFRCGKNLYAIVQQRRKENFFISIDESIRLLWVLKALFAYATGFSSKGIIILCFAYFAIYIYLYTTYKRRRSLMVCIYKW